MKIAETTPPACSVCWQTRDDIRHVDFEVATEGPVIYEGVTPAMVDSIVICEACLKQGSELVGLVDWAERAEELTDLKTQLAAAEQALAEKTLYADRLEAAVAAKPGRRTSGTRPRSTSPSPTAQREAAVTV